MNEQDIKDFKNAHRRAYFECGFTWKSDQARLGVVESWNSLYPVMLSGGKLVGDCEDVALAIVDFCIAAGVPADIVGIARIKTRGSDAHFFDHAVAVLLNSKGEVELVSDCNTPDRVLRKIQGEPYDFLSAKDLVEGNRPRIFGS